MKNFKQNIWGVNRFLKYHRNKKYFEVLSGGSTNCVIVDDGYEIYQGRFKQVEYILKISNFVGVMHYFWFYRLPGNGAQGHNIATSL